MRTTFGFALGMWLLASLGCSPNPGPPSDAGSDANDSGNVVGAGDGASTSPGNDAAVGKDAGGGTKKDSGHCSKDDDDGCEHEGDDDNGDHHND